MHYWQIRGNILLLRSIAPLSIIYCVLLICHSLRILPSSLEHSWLWHVPSVIQYWMIAEALSYICLYMPYKYYFLQSPADHPKALPREKREELFRRCWDTVDDAEEYLKGWFRGARKEDIARENVRTFIHWAFFNAREIPVEDEAEVDKYLDMVEARLGRKLAPGWGSAVSLRTTLDTVHVTYRSIAWYMCIVVVDLISHCSMLKNGYQFYGLPHSRFWTLFPIRILTLLSSHKTPAKHTTYWYREHKSKDRLPVLFIHGVGVGLYPYTNFLRDINIKTGYFGDMDDTVGIIAIEIMAVSSRLTAQALDKDILVNEIKCILDYHRWTKCVLVGHSYGTVISTHLLKSPRTANLIGPVVLIDPICFLLHLPDVAYNFTARQPSHGHAKELVLWYFGSMDIGIAHTLGRRFFWVENILWKEDLRDEDGEERDVTVVLSGKDDIVDVNAVRRYLSSVKHAAAGCSGANGMTSTLPDNSEKNKAEMDADDGIAALSGKGLETVWLEGFHHAQAFDFETMRDCLAKIVRRYTERRA